MKKVVVFFCFAMVIFGACSAQKAEAQSVNNAQKIIGTWVDSRGNSTWIFNANGTSTTSYKDSSLSYEYKFVVVDTKLVTQSSRLDYNPEIYDILISSDGKTLILNYVGSGTTYCIWLTKK